VATNDDAEKVNKIWGAPRTAIDQSNHWINHPVSRAHLNQRITGDPGVDFLTYWSRGFFTPPLESALSVGCGFGPSAHWSVADSRSASLALI
jgi:hypothetical protein